MSELESSVSKTGTTENGRPENTCGILTATGRGAVAVIALWGSNVAAVIDELFDSVSKKRLSESTEQRIFYGVWSSTGEDVVVVRPAGFGDLASVAWEVHCHGGMSAPLSIVKSLGEHGFHQLDQQQIVRRAHGGRWRSELAMEMSRALTETTARHLLHQYSIADLELNRIRVLLDSDPSAAESELVEMLAWSEFGRHLTEPWSVVFCGEPNVGKSSLVNAIVGFNRAIVHEAAGTTRDVVSQVTAIDGWPVEIKDTAGLRDATDAIEKKGIELGKAEIRIADLVVAVLEARKSSPLTLPAALTQRKPDIIVFSKADLCSVEAIAGLAKSSSVSANLPTFVTSAENGTGIQEIVKAIASWLAETQPATGRLIPCTPRQVNLIRSVLEMLRDGRRAEAVSVFHRFDSQ